MTTKTAPLIDGMIDFLHARLTEAEKVAIAAAWNDPTCLEWEYADAGWQYWRIQTVQTHGSGQEHVAITHDSEGLSDSVDEEAGPHIALHDPAAVLASVSAQRTILNRYAEWRRDEAAAREDFGNWLRGNAAPTSPHRDTHPTEGRGLAYAISALTAAYSTHPDFRPEWIA